MPPIVRLVSQIGHGKDLPSRYDYNRARMKDSIQGVQPYSQESREMDRQATAFEDFVCYLFGVPSTAWILEVRHGPAFTWQNLGVKPYLIEASYGHNFILNETLERYPAEIYVVGRGKIEEGFEVLGYCHHDDVMKSIPQPFGKYPPGHPKAGQDRPARHYMNAWRFSDLWVLLQRSKPPMPVAPPDATPEQLRFLPEIP